MEPTIALPVLIGLIGIALAFDFINGLHDAANSIATVVSTRVLSPQLAVAWAAFFNFVAFIFIGMHVAETIGKGIIDPAIVDPAVIFGALAGAILWNVMTWWLGHPVEQQSCLRRGARRRRHGQGRTWPRSSRPVSSRPAFSFSPRRCSE